MSDLIRWTHVLAGTVALLSFMIPMLTHKGGKIHRKSGWVFVWSMGISAVTAMALTIITLVNPDAALGHKLGAGFLLFISILSLNNLGYGLRALKFKKRDGSHRNPFDLGLSIKRVVEIAIINLCLAIRRHGQP